ncbi:MAG: DUF1348 family protein [Solirubrobacteraceae bacterium]
MDAVGIGRRCSTGSETQRRRGRRRARTPEQPRRRPGRCRAILRTSAAIRTEPSDRKGGNSGGQRSARGCSGFGFGARDEHAAIRQRQRRPDRRDGSQYESRDAAGQWWRGYGTQQLEFDDQGRTRTADRAHRRDCPRRNARAIRIRSRNAEAPLVKDCPRP